MRVNVSEHLNTLVFESVSEEEVAGAINRLKSKRSMGSDCIPSYVIKGCGDSLVKPILHLINTSLSQGKFPQKLKVAKVCPVPKVPNTDNICDFRPISVINVFGKIFESILYARIYDHIRPWLSSSQYGFQKGRSIITNLVNFSQAVHDTLNRGCQLDVIYTDFRKAFDLVQFDVLLRKLRYCGFSPDLVRLFWSYLGGRQQYVSFQGCLSPLFGVPSGVPQGSNLGPLLFLIMVNDIPDSFINSHCYLFADDLKFHREIKSTVDCELLQEDLNRLVSWCTLNRLYLNIEKCSVMSFGLIKEKVVFDYSIQGISLERVCLVKDLGVWFDGDLRFDSHVNNKVNEAYRMLGFIKRSCYALSNKTAFLMLYNAYVRSKLEFASIIWESLQENRINQVEMVQKKFLKFLSKKIYGIDDRFTTYSVVLARHEACALSIRRSQANFLYAFKILHGFECNQSFLERFFFNVRPRGTRQTTLIYLPFARIELFKASPIYRVCSTVNRYEELDIFCTSLRQIKTFFKSKPCNNLG